MNEKKALKKKGMKLFAKLTLILLIPLTFLTAFAILAAKAVANDVSVTLIKHDLEAGSFGVEQVLNGISDGDYSLVDDKLYKGDVCLTDSDILENFKKEVTLEATLFYGDVRKATSIRGNDGNLILDTKAAPEVAESVLGGGTEFKPSIMIEGIEHYGYYKPLENQDGSIIGMLFIGIRSEIAKESFAVTIKSNVAFLIVICAIAVLAGMWFAVILAKGLAKVVKHLDQVAEGDLDIEVDEKLATRADEIGNVARAIEKAIAAFSAIVKYIIKASASVKNLADDFNGRFDVITEAVGNVNIAVTGIADGATSQANETQNVSEKVNDMGYAIDETRDFVEKLSGNSSKMKEYNAEVQRTIDELADINVQTKTSAQAVYDQTHTTNRSAEEIRTAVDVIADIAGQTNLLSLNASIEAARAGEHGRGFAVVAEEIRTLADQSKESAEMINNVITQLIENSNASVATIDEMLEIMAKQSEKLKMTSDTFVELNEEVNEVNAGVGQISDKVMKLDSLKLEVLSSTENLAAIAEENAASTEETAATMTELNQNVEECKTNAGELAMVANQLLDSVGQVKVSQD